MAATKILADTGPLVAYLVQTDEHHRWALATFGSFYEPIYTCEAVVSEVLFLLRSANLAVETFLQMLERKTILLDFSMEENRADVLNLLRKYADQPMSLADACLVRMAELNDNCQIFTTDRDFLVYRRKGRSVIPLLAPFA
jgi:predicted nucleic acid-binding protein